MTRQRHGSAIVEFPNDLEVLLTRDFDAPIELVFDVLTKPEHVNNWFAPFEDKMTVCSIDLRVGGSYHMVFVTSDGTECSFRGTYLEVERPTRLVDTWLFEGWPDAEAVETVVLHEADGVTTMTNSLAFRDKAGRDHMSKTDGMEDSFDKLEDYLRSVVDPNGTTPGRRRAGTQTEQDGRRSELVGGYSCSDSEGSGGRSRHPPERRGP